MEDPASKVAHLLNELERNQEAAPKLFELLYDDLRRMARHHLQRERPDHTLQATALVHEAYIRLAHADQRLETRGHFYVIASSAMRRVLVDHARAKKAAKRPGSRQKVELDDAPLLVREQYDDILTLNHALDQLEKVDERLCRVVELRYFGGLTADETAVALGTSVITVHRDWAAAKAWLSADLSRRPSLDPSRGAG